MGNKRKTFTKVRGGFTKKILVKPGNLGEFGFVAGKSSDKTILEAFIRRGIPCLIHNARYLKEWKRNYEHQ